MQPAAESNMYRHLLVPVDATDLSVEVLGSAVALVSMNSVCSGVTAGCVPGLAASQRRDLLPVYSFDAKSLWIMNQRKESQLAGDADRLKLWADYRSRISQDHFKSPRMIL